MKKTSNQSIETVSIDTITPYEKNAKEHNQSQVKKIARSIEAFGFAQPIVVDKSNVVIVGHGRLEAAKMLKMNEVPIIRLTIDEKKVAAYRLADNKLNESDWNMELVVEELKGLDDAGLVDLTGFSSDLILEKEDEEDLVPLPPKESKAKPGDLYKLGRHRLMCGDSTSIDAVEMLMGGEKADMVFTDPPYGVSYEGGHNAKKRQQIKNDALEGKTLTGLFYGALSVAITVTHDHAPFYVWYADGKSVETYAAFSDLPLSLLAVIQWYKVKSGIGAFMSQYIPNCEPCIYAFKTGSSPQWFGPTDEKTVWELQKESRNEYNPTQKPVELPAQKPVELPERAITNSTKTGQIVLDMFGGSGSTLIACEKTGRICYMMEFDTKYVDVIVQRWEEYTGEKAELVEKVI